MLRRLLFIAVVLLVSGRSAVAAEDAAVTVELETSEVPHLRKWGEDAAALIVRWHPRVCNLIPVKGFQPPRKITLKIRKTSEGVAATSGTVITVSSGWIEKHPEDIGLVFHELVHVIQAYPSGDPWWLTEGIADYLRWAIYEGKQQPWFPRPRERRGYLKGYRVTAGFLCWLETEKAPGIVKKLNTAMRGKEYSSALFESETGQTLDALWDEYANVKPEPR